MRTVDVARRSGYSVQQIRLLERSGVLPVAPRSPSGYRRYSSAHVDAALAYRSLAVALGPVDAKRVLRAVHEGPLPRVLVLLEGAYAGLHRERRDVQLARRAAGAIVGEPMADPRPEDAMTISELADALGIRPSALRHWEAEGLLVPARSADRRRVYAPTDVRDARVVHQLRQASYGIPVLQKLLPRLRSGHGWEQVGRALADREADLDERSRHLVRATAAIEALLG